MKSNKESIKRGDSVIFKTGNLAGLTGEVLSVDLNSKEPRAIFGIWIEVLLSNGEIGYIEKSEHWDFLEGITLNLTGKQFSLIWEGFKTVEYRDITPLYCSKFLLWDGGHKPQKWWFDWFFYNAPNYQILKELMDDFKEKNITFKEFEYVNFNNGMRKIIPRMKFEVESISIGEGDEVLGAKKGVSYFRIHLGSLISYENINLLK